MKGNKCAWDQYNCTQDPNDSNYVLQTVNAMRGLGATGRVYAYGTSNGANEVQILGANSMDDAGQALPIVGIAARSGQMLSKPTRSGPGPFDYNQPCAGDNPCTGGRGVAQLSIHDTDDPVIPYAGGARFHSPVFILSGEEASCETWARQNGCNTTMTNATVAATTHKGGSTTANYVQWDGCPATAPVELYKVEGGSHVGTSAIRGKDVMVTVFEVRTCVCVCVCVCVWALVSLIRFVCAVCMYLLFVTTWPTYRLSSYLPFTENGTSRIITQTVLYEGRKGVRWAPAAGPVHPWIVKRGVVDITVLVNFEYVISFVRKHMRRLCVFLV